MTLHQISIVLRGRHPQVVQQHCTVAVAEPQSHPYCGRIIINKYAIPTVTLNSVSKFIEATRYMIEYNLVFYDNL
jgi:hypothetical protein